MSVLIRGMEMPKCCASCQLRNRDGIWLRCMITGRNIEPESLRGTIASVCPLIEVPTPHGDLIDRDAINYEDEVWKKKCIPSQVVYNAWVVAGEMPTIIPAEEGD